MSNDEIGITALELEYFFPNNTGHNQLEELATNITGYMIFAKARMVSEVQKQDDFQSLDKLRKTIKKSLSVAQDMQEVFNDGIRKTAVKDFIWHGNMLIKCIPPKKPTSIPKKTLGALFELIYMECEKISKDVKYFTKKNPEKIAFFQICEQVVDNMNLKEDIGFEITDSTISKYITDISKPNSTIRKRSIENLGKNYSFNELFNELEQQRKLYNFKKNHNKRIIK